MVLYEANHVQLCSSDGLSDDWKMNAWFQEAIPPEAKETTQRVIRHPLDSNLFAFSCTDRVTSTVIIKNVHLGDVHQVLCKSKVHPDGSTPIPFMFFTPSGRMFVLCKAVDKSELGRPPQVTLETFQVPDTALVPSTRSVNQEKNKFQPSVQRTSYPCLLYTSPSPRDS